MKRFITTAALIAFAAIPLSSLAGQDEGQRLITQRLQEQKLKLAAAEKAQGAERDKLMQDHMNMMQETMGKMQAMKPRDGMTPQEHIGMGIPIRDAFITEVILFFPRCLSTKSSGMKARSNPAIKMPNRQ